MIEGSDPDPYLWLMDRIRIREAQKHVDPVDPDPDPQHWKWPLIFFINTVQYGYQKERNKILILNP